MAGAFCACEPLHRNAPSGTHGREDVLYRAAIPISLLCPLDRAAIAIGCSLPEVVEQAIREYCVLRGVWLAEG